MKKLIDRVLRYVAVLAKGAAVFSAGKASMGGMYEPKMPENISYSNCRENCEFSEGKAKY